MSYVEAEIASQPACWRAAARLGAASAGTLPLRGQRVAAVGCGTSWFISMAYAALRETAGLGETDAFAASEYPFDRDYDRVVAITRSGATTEVLDLLRALPPHTASTALIGDPGSPAVALVRDAIPLPFADERSVVQTRFATSALALLRASLGEDLSHAITDAEAVLDTALPVDPAVAQVTFLGRGWTVGLAYEAALKCREAAGLWAEAYPAMDYRHGPIAIAEPGRLVWALGDVPPGLAADIASTGATFVHHGGRDPLAELVLAQRLAVALSVHRGLDPDAPRHLTRSVVLR